MTKRSLSAFQLVLFVFVPFVLLPGCGFLATLPCRGVTGAKCPLGSFCKLPPGSCDAVDPGGVCMPFPDLCAELFDPVCGCDGVTYANLCLAEAEGINISHAGVCEEITSGPAEQ